MEFSPFGGERGDLTKWDIEQVFGTITCLLKTPTPKPHPTTKVSFHLHCASLGSSLAPHLILAPTIPAFPTIMPPNKRATHLHRMKPAGGSDGLLCLQWGIFYTNFGLLSCQRDLFYTNFLEQVACGVKMVTHTIDRNYIIENFTKCVDQSCI